MALGSAFSVRDPQNDGGASYCPMNKLIQQIPNDISLRDQFDLSQSFVSILFCDRNIEFRISQNVLITKVRETVETNGTRVTDTCSVTF